MTYKENIIISDSRYTKMHQRDVLADIFLAQETDLEVYFANFMSLKEFFLRELHVQSCCKIFALALLIICTQLSGVG